MTDAVSLSLTSCPNTRSKQENRYFASTQTCPTTKWFGAVTKIMKNKTNNAPPQRMGTRPRAEPFAIRDRRGRCRPKSYDAACFSIPPKAVTRMWSAKCMTQQQAGGEGVWRHEVSSPSRHRPCHYLVLVGIHAQKLRALARTLSSQRHLGAPRRAFLLTILVSRSAAHHNSNVTTPHLHNQTHV
jgi:hypothetical protein